jgi:ABC-type protease/lipase transport system fused ATPase/permease subunit
MVQQLRARNVTMVIVTHKLNILNHCDDVLVLNNGTVQASGPRDQIINRLPRSSPPPALTVIAGTLESQRAS